MSSSMVTFPRAPTSIPAQLALGLTAVGLSVLGRFWLDPILGDRAPFIFTLATLAALAWVLSAGPYFAAALAGLIAVEYLFVTPRYSPGLEGPADALQFANYVFLTAVLWFAAQTARRHAARALEASEALRRKDELLHTVADGSATLLAYVDRDLRYRFINAAYCQYFDVKAESVLGRTVPEQLGGTAFAALRPYIDRVLAGDAVTFETDLPYPTLGVRRMHVGYTPHPGADGVVVGYTAAINDITDRVRAEEAAAHLAAIVESTDDAVISKDLSGRIRSFNAGAERLLGYHAAEVIGQPITTFIPGERIAEESEILRRIRAGERVEHLETVRLTKDGRRVDVSLTVSPIRDHAGAIVGASKIARDITHRKSAEADLRHSEERLRIALEAGRMGTWEWNIRTGAVAWSTALEALHGLAPGTFPGTFEAFQSDMHPEDRERVLAAIASCARDRTDHHIEYRIIRPDGRTVWVEGRGRLFLDDTGEPLRMSGVCIDVTERKQAESELRQSEERLRLAQVGSGVWDWDIAANSLFWTDEYYDLFGLDRSVTPTYEAWLHSVLPEDRAAADAAIREILRSESDTVETQFRIIHPNRGVRWLHVVGHLFRDDARRPVRMTGTNIDITDRKLAEDALRESEARFRAAVEAVSSLIWTNSPDGRMLGEQPGWAAFTGQSLDEYQDYGWAQAVHPDDAQPTIDAWNRTVAERRTFVFEHRLRRRDGRYRLCSIRAVPVLAADGAVREWVGVHTDITDQRAAEQALRDSEERLRLALDAGQIGIHEYAPATGALLWDARLRAMWGIGPDDPVNIDTFWRGLHPDDHDEVAARLARATDPHSPDPFDMEYRVLPPDGSPQRWIHATGQSSFVGKGADRRADRFVGTARDVTAPKLAAEEIARYRQRLEDLVRQRTAQLEHSQHALRLAERMAALGTFAAGLGHDMSNLLLPIRARLESIESLAGESPELREDTDAIKGSLRYIEAVTRGLRLFAQDPEQNVDGVTNLPRWCADIESLLRASLPKHIALRCNIPPDAPTVAVSPHRLSQAVLNLVHNARDSITAARPSDGAITLSATIDDDTDLVRLCIQDDGAGMTDEVRRRCTEPFYTTKNRGLGGTGLGLAIVHGVAESAGGRIEIRSAPGEGAAVSLLLPVAPIDASDEPPARRPAFITIADTRTAAFAASLLASMGREPIAAAPINGVPADALWVTDATPQSAQVAASFLAGAAARRVIALGGDTQWSALGAIITDHDSLPRLRQAFEQASRPSR